jgi:hypothetical protein
MKRRVIIGSIVAVFLIAFIPVSNAIQIHTVQNKMPSSYISYDTIKNMNYDELVVFIGTLAQDYPQLHETFQLYVDEMNNALASSVMTKQRADILANENQDQQPTNDNQTILEKIFWGVFKYRVFRLYISTCLFLFFQSKFTLWRTMTWGIRLLRWVKIGILLGVIDPGQQKPYTPSITFEQDKINKTLMVLSVSPTTVQWSNIVEIGEGSCDPFPSGVVTVGDTLTSCTGIIVLNYLPTDEILGVFSFD